jgi:hypothetical protein
MNQTVLAQELVLRYELWKVLREIFLSFCHPCRIPTKTYFSRRNFHSRCVSYENCKRPRRNYTPKGENCFAIFISVYNFHISLQFSYQFALLTFQSIVPTWTFAIFIWVCNFHISLQFSHNVTQLQHVVCGFAWIPCHYDLKLINSTSATVLCGRQR